MGVNFFLQHALDLLDPQSEQLWLMRFKELDLRIMQWKLYLPPKWRDASVLNEDGIMDPNLTLAHITHNTGDKLFTLTLSRSQTAYDLP